MEYSSGIVGERWYQQDIEYVLPFLRTDESLRFALCSSKQTEEVALIANDHLIQKLAMELASQELQQVALPVCSVKAFVFYIPGAFPI